MKSLSEVIADFYIEKNIISSDMKSVYVYGISLIINDIIDFDTSYNSSTLYIRSSFSSDILYYKDTLRRISCKEIMDMCRGYVINIYTGLFMY
mgnify:CR=1 FL=1